MAKLRDIVNDPQRQVIEEVLREDAPAIADKLAAASVPNFATIVLVLAQADDVSEDATIPTLICHRATVEDDLLIVILRDYADSLEHRREPNLLDTH